MNRLPGFSLADYATLLAQLRDCGYRLQPVSSLLNASDAPVVYLRHDIDFFPRPALEMGRIESAAGARATYYFLLSGPYNLFAPENRAVVRSLAELGHEIGLHYDLRCYPEETAAARHQLEFEAGILRELSGAPIQTISMHQPHKSPQDLFRGLEPYVNPHDARDRRPLTYISDSCRAWRDETLLQCFGPDRPLRVQLLTHPESWLDGSIENRLAYLDSVVLPNATRDVESYYRNEVRRIWTEHPGPRAHDARTRMAQPQHGGNA